jgi:hypothetical protein
MKKVIISLFALVGLGCSVAMPLNASTQSMQKSTQHQGQYEVFSRSSKHSAWKSEGTYPSKDEALRTVRKLHGKGLNAVYEHH